MLSPAGLCPKVGRVDGPDAEVVCADGFGSRAGEEGVGSEGGSEVECADEVGGVLGAGEERDGDTTAGGGHGGVCGGGLGEHQRRFEFVLSGCEPSVGRDQCK